MNNTFGKIKTSLLNKLTESYVKQDTEDIKNLLNIINEDRNFKELYLLYEDIENKYFEDAETAKFYVDELSKSLNGKVNELSKTIKKFDEKFSVSENNKIYELLDILLENDNLLNIDAKVKSKVELVKVLTTKKEITESSVDNYTNNEKLLMTVLTNDFNSYYTKALSESDKEKLKEILSLKNSDIEEKIKDLSENIVNKITELLNESNDIELKIKLESVKSEVNCMKPNKYNYFKLLELKNGLV